MCIVGEVFKVCAYYESNFTRKAGESVSLEYEVKIKPLRNLGIEKVDTIN
jgi:hypothetical protein